jgi:hypothetical protein
MLLQLEDLGGDPLEGVRAVDELFVPHHQSSFDSDRSATYAPIATAATSAAISVDVSCCNQAPNRDSILRRLREKIPA